MLPASSRLKGSVQHYRQVTDKETVFLPLSTIFWPVLFNIMCSRRDHATSFLNSGSSFNAQIPCYISFLHAPCNRKRKVHAKAIVGIDSVWIELPISNVKEFRDLYPSLPCDRQLSSNAPILSTFAARRVAGSNRQRAAEPSYHPFDHVRAQSRTPPHPLCPNCMFKSPRNIR